LIGLASGDLVPSHRLGTRELKPRKRSGHAPPNDFRMVYQLLEFLCGQPAVIHSEIGESAKIRRIKAVEGVRVCQIIFQRRAQTLNGSSRIILLQLDGGADGGQGVILREGIQRKFLTNSIGELAVAALPQNAEALSMRGSIELYRNQTDEAYRDFSAAAELAPRSPDPRFFMSLVDYRQSKFDQAAKVLRDAIASGIADSDLHYMLAECVLRIDPSNASAALSELDRAIQLNPKSVPARILRGETLLAARRPQDAVVDLKIARDRDPNPQRDTSNTTYLLGRAYVALAKRDQANALFAQLGHQFTPNQTDTLNQLGNQKIQAVLHP
jgi:tetratricopeptide (TPR) repeat protein